MILQLGQLEVAANERSSTLLDGGRVLARAPCKARLPSPRGIRSVPADAKRLADGLQTDIDSVTLTALVAASC